MSRCDYSDSKIIDLYDWSKVNKDKHKNSYIVFWIGYISKSIESK